MQVAGGRGRKATYGVALRHSLLLQSGALAGCKLTVKQFVARGFLPEFCNLCTILQLVWLPDG